MEKIRYKNLISQIIKEHKTTYPDYPLKFEFCSQDEIKLRQPHEKIMEQIGEEGLRGLFVKDYSFIWVSSDREPKSQLVTLLHEMGHCSDSHKRKNSLYGKNYTCYLNQIDQEEENIKTICKKMYYEKIKQEEEANKYAIEYIKNRNWTPEIRKELLKSIKDTLRRIVQSQKNTISIEDWDEEKVLSKSIFSTYYRTSSINILKLYF